MLNEITVFVCDKCECFLDTPGECPGCYKPMKRRKFYSRPTKRAVDGAFAPDASDIALKDMLDKNGGMG